MAEKIKDKINKIFGMEMSEDDQYFDDEFYDDEYEDEPQEEPAQETVIKPSRAKATSQSPMTGKPRSNKSAFGIATGPEVLVLDPERFEDAPGIVKKIKEEKTVVVNLKNTEFEEGKKIFDFLNGAVFALDGSINKIAQNVFILAPKQVYVTTAMERDDTDTITPILNFEDEG